MMHRHPTSPHVHISQQNFPDLPLPCLAQAQKRFGNRLPATAANAACYAQLVLRPLAGLPIFRLLTYKSDSGLDFGNAPILIESVLLSADVQS